MAIKIITDSASDISQKEAEQLGIIMVPLQVRFDQEEFFDGVTLSKTEFYEKLIECDTLPQTSQITPYRFEEAFKKATAEGDEVLAVLLSSKLSGTYQSAVTAAEKFDGKVAVIDSLSAAVGERLLVMIALDLVKQGKTIAEIVNELNIKKQKLRILAMLNTLEYLKKGGRISSSVAMAGKLLSIKPVVALVDGEVKLLGKAMGSKNAKNLLNSLIEKTGGIDFDLPLGTIWSGLNDIVLKKYIEDSAHLWQEHREKVPAYCIGCTIGTHVGPNAVGVAFFSKN